jgi:hypothetical protein
MIVTPNLGLVAWDSETDPYDHEQLAANWVRIDQHDHTGGGRGVQIGTNALEQGAVTVDKIAPGVFSSPSGFTIVDGSISTNKLANNAVTSAKITDGSVTSAKLASGLALPTGAIIAFGGASAPSGWLLCDGSTVSTTTYATLFGVVGTSYGAGLASPPAGTFYLPDGQGRTLVGLNSTNSNINARGKNEGNTTVATREPNHNHGSGTLALQSGAGFRNIGGGTSTSTVVGSTASTAPPFQVVNYIIKT